MSKVLIADFGTGNLHSVITAIEVVGRSFDVAASRSESAIRNADRLVLPGQGAIGTWMGELQNDEVRLAVEDALRNKPVLGICLGLQALYEHSDEDGGVDGLNVLAGRVERFEEDLFDGGRKNQDSAYGLERSPPDSASSALERDSTGYPVLFRAQLPCTFQEGLRSGGGFELWT